MPVIQVAEVTVGCAQLHLTSVRMISPVVDGEGGVEGLLSSSAQFCDVCESPAMTTLDAMIREEDVPLVDVDMYRVRFTT